MRTAGPLDPAVDRFSGDLSESTDLSAAAAGCDAIVHVAGLLKARTQEEYREVNARGTERLARKARASAGDAPSCGLQPGGAGPARGGYRSRGGSGAPRFLVRDLEAGGGARPPAGMEGPWIVLRPGVLLWAGRPRLLTYFARRLPAGSLFRRAGRDPVGRAGDSATTRWRRRRPKTSPGTAFPGDPDPIAIGHSRAHRGLPKRARVFRSPPRPSGRQPRWDRARSVYPATRPFNADKARELLAGTGSATPDP